MQAAFTNQATVFVSVRGVWYGVTCLDARVELKWLKSSQPYLEHRHRQKHPKEIPVRRHPPSDAYHTRYC